MPAAVAASARQVPNAGVRISHSSSRRPQSNRSSSASSGCCKSRSQASTCLEVAEVAGCRGLGPNLRENIVCFGSPAPREQNVYQRYAAEREKTRHTGVLERAQGIRLRVGQRAAAQAGVRAQLSGHRERRQRPVLLRPLDHLGADPHLRRHQRARGRARTARSRTRPTRGPGSSSSRPSASACRARSRASAAVPVRAASYAAIATCRRSPTVRGVPDCDDEPLPRRLETTPDRNAAPRMLPSASPVAAAPARAQLAGRLVDDRREIGQRLLRPLCEEERRTERVRRLARAARSSAKTASCLPELLDREHRARPALSAALPNSWTSSGSSSADGGSASARLRYCDRERPARPRLAARPWPPARSVFDRLCLSARSSRQQVYGDPIRRLRPRRSAGGRRARGSGHAPGSSAPSTRSIAPAGGRTQAAWPAREVSRLGQRVSGVGGFVVAQGGQAALLGPARQARRALRRPARGRYSQLASASDEHAPLDLRPASSAGSAMPACSRLGAMPRRSSSLKSSRSKNGLPRVARWQAATKAGSGAADNDCAASSVIACSLRPSGWRTVTSGITSNSSCSSCTAPGSAGRVANTSASCTPASRRAR